MKPYYVTENTVLTTYNRLKIVGPKKLKVDEIVRISKVKHVFNKGYTPKWTTELFKIAKVLIK